MVTVDEGVVLLGVTKTIAVLLGLLLTWFAWRAYRIKRERTLLGLAIGMGVLTLSAIAEGAVYNFLNWPLVASQTVGALTTVGGFGVMLYSLRG